MRKFSKILALIALIVLVICTLVGCSYQSVINLNDLSLQYEPDGSIAQLTGDKSEQLLSNIDRGFRLETYYTLGSGKAWPADKESDGYQMLNEEIEYYKNDKAVEIQVYIYLTEYYDKPLDDRAFDQLKKYFEYIRSQGMSMLLRFAYDYEQPSNVSPTQDMMMTHIEQIKKFNMANDKLIKDTVTAYQFGMIGAWGEWGSTKQKYKEKAILDALIDAFPDGTYFQGRYSRVVKQTDKNERSEYVGYHNDFMVGRPHPWNSAGDKYNSKDYKKFFNNAPYRLNDGEMPWGGYTDEPGEKVDGIKFLVQAREHCLSTLSIKHNYIEEREDKNGVMQNSHNIARWKTEYVTPQVLKDNKLPYYEGWFKDINGNAINRSVYEYLRDYLGYVLVLDNMQMTTSAQNSQLSFVITNYGLGTPLTIRNMEIVVADRNSDGSIDYNSVENYYVNSYDCKKLVTYGQQKITFNYYGNLANKAIGIRLTRGDYAIKTTNDILFENGINFIK